MKPKATLKRNKRETNEKWSYVSTHPYRLPSGGESFSVVYIRMLNDGSVTINDPHSENLIYLYPEQVTQLRKLLAAK